MYDYRRARRGLVLLVSGGLLLQVAGCATGLVPVVLSFIESTLVNTLLTGFFPP